MRIFSRMNLKYRPPNPSMAEDRTDPVCGMRGTIRAHGKWFCSRACIEKYEKEQGLPFEESHEFCPECQVKHPAWYHERIYQVLAAIMAFFTVDLLLSRLYGITVLSPVAAAFYDYTSIIWLPVLAGFLIGGMIDYFIPREYISKYLARASKRTILYAVALGFLMSACSHGILALSIQLYKKGASVPAVIAFLLASPWANLPITILLFGLFGWKALYFIVSALVIAVITGLIYQLLEARGLVETNRHTLKVDPKFSVWKDASRRIRGWKLSAHNLSAAGGGIAAGSWSLAKMVLWWVLIGMFIASLARAFIPADAFHEYMGPTVLGLFVTLLLATIIEVCSEGSAPMAFEIYFQTKAFGNAFAFLMAGVATDYTEVGLIWANIGKRAAILLPIITVPQILILAYLFNTFL